MAIVVFEHHPVETSARLGAILRNHGHRLNALKMHDGASVPVDLDGVDGVVSMGGPMNVGEEAKYPWMAAEIDYIRQAHEAKLPVVGICLGAQFIAAALGGKVEEMDKPEIGWHEVKLAFPGTIDPIYAGTPWLSTPFHMHGRQVTELPPDSTPLAGSKACRNQAFKVGLTTYGFQYHFEWDPEQIRAVTNNNRGWMISKDIDPADVEAGMDTYYPMYAQLSARLCTRINDLLFPVDRRYRNVGGQVASFHAS